MSLLAPDARNTLKDLCPIQGSYLFAFFPETWLPHACSQARSDFLCFAVLPGDSFPVTKLVSTTGERLSIITRGLDHCVVFSYHAIVTLIV